jgi:hypothetical protein
MSCRLRRVLRTKRTPPAWLPAVGALLLACAAGWSIRAAPPARLDLASALGQGFSAYERSLGKPTGERADPGASGRYRTYRAAGFVFVRLGRSAGSETVSQLELGFPRNLRSWKAALAQVGLPAAGMTLHRRGQGFGIQGLPVGWTGTWTPNDPASKSHILRLSHAAAPGQADRNVAAGRVAAQGDASLVAPEGLEFSPRCLPSYPAFRNLKNWDEPLFDQPHPLAARQRVYNQLWVAVKRLPRLDELTPAERSSKKVAASLRTIMDATVPTSWTDDERAFACFRLCLDWTVLNLYYDGGLRRRLYAEPPQLEGWAYKLTPDDFDRGGQRQWEAMASLPRPGGVVCHGYAGVTKRLFSHLTATGSVPRSYSVLYVSCLLRTGEGHGLAALVDSHRILSIANPTIMGPLIDHRQATARQRLTVDRPYEPAWSLQGASESAFSVERLLSQNYVLGLKETIPLPPRFAQLTAHLNEPDAARRSSYRRAYHKALRPYYGLMRSRFPERSFAVRTSRFEDMPFEPGVGGPAIYRDITVQDEKQRLEWRNWADWETQTDQLANGVAAKREAFNRSVGL